MIGQVEAFVIEVLVEEICTMELGEGTIARESKDGLKGWLHRIEQLMVGI